MKRHSTTALYLLLALVVAISFSYFFAGALALRQEFFHAAQYTRQPFAIGDDGRSLKELRPEATRAGLHEGDRLLALDGTPFTGSEQLHSLVQRLAPGQPLTVTVRPDSGAARQVTLRSASREGPDFSLGTYIAFLAPVLGVPLLGLLVGTWVVAARPRDLNAWLVLVLLAFPETAFGNLDWQFWPAPWYLLLGLWNVLLQLSVFPALLWLGFLFPERWRVDRRLPWLKFAFLALTAVLFFGEVWILRDQLFAVDSLPALGHLGVWLDRLSSWIQTLSVVLFLVALFDKLRTASTADARRRLRVLAIGSALSLGPLLLLFGFAPLLHINPHQGKWFLAVIPLLSLFPLTLAYVLIVHRAMDVRILLRMGTRYLLARATLVTLQGGILALLVFGFPRRLVRNPQHPVLTFLLLAAAIVFALQVFVLRRGLGAHLQQWLDRRFFREAYNSELLLSELSGEVRQLTDPHLLVNTVLRRISDVLHVPQIAVLLRSGGNFHLQQALGTDLALPVQLSGHSATIQHLARTSQPATVYPDRPAEWYVSASPEERATLHQLNAELLLPVAGRDHLLGLLALGPKRSEEPYTPVDLHTLQSVAAQTGLTLELTELVQTLAAEVAQRERIDREMEIAREVQERLFPQHIPQLPGLSLAGACRPASEVGGDYFDLIPLDTGHLGFAIGDVSGKGISAALIMASLRASLRGLILSDSGDLGRRMQQVNRLVYEASSSSRYATFFFATFDPASRELRFVNAGHNPPVLLRAATGEAVRLQASGPVVGLLPNVLYEAETLTLEPGDLLLAYTDGISEAMTHDDEEWGEDRLIAAARPHTHLPAPALVDHLFQAADAFTAGARQHDDMTLLLLKLDA